MEDDGVTSSTLPKRYADVFEHWFPYYLAIGMTEKEYWDGYNDYPKAYYQAEKLRQRQQNAMLWLQGRYVYDAMLAASPALNAMSTASIKPYLQEPYPITAVDAEEREEREQQRKMEERKAQMLAWMQRVNAARE